MVGYSPKKVLGQHWLTDEQSLLAMVDAAKVTIGDEILEIGPGQGSLTKILLKKGANIIAVELDGELVNLLDKNISDRDHLTIVNQNILEFNLLNLPKNYKIVANIPYYLTSNLIRLISETANPPALAVLLVQKEVAQRVCAEPGEMSILSVITQMYFCPSLGRIVEAQLFTPPPKVDSQILILKRREHPLFRDQNSHELFALIKAGFSERRKKLRSSLSGGLCITKQAADNLLIKSGIDPNWRAQNLQLDDWLKLSQTWTKFAR